MTERKVKDCFKDFTESTFFIHKKIQYIHKIYL